MIIIETVQVIIIRFCEKKQLTILPPDVKRAEKVLKIEMLLKKKF